MDLISGFKSELFRPLAILVAPGAFATVPFYLLIQHHNPELLSFADKNPLAMAAALLIVATAAGMILENVGSRIERGIDQCLQEKYLPKHDKRWDDYLCLKTDSELVAQRYLRTLVTRAKFVYSFIPALAAALLGIVFLHSHLDRWTDRSVVAWSALIVIVICFLFVEGVRLSEVMSATRCRVLSAMHKNSSNPELKWPGMRTFATYAILHVLGRHPEKIKKLMAK